MKWWVHNLKHKELYSRYNMQPDPKPIRQKFASRVVIYWASREEALNCVDYLKKRKRERFWTVIKEDWRVCSKCKQFKEWNQFSKTRDWINWFSSNCKECRNKQKMEYRKRTQYAKDHEYKIRKRNLNAWDQIYFQDDIREVKEYKMKKWYLVKSILNGTERRISTADNHYCRNNSCVRYRKLKTALNIETKTKEETF